MSRKLRAIVGWCHLYAGLLVGLNSPGTGALFIAVGLCWWIDKRDHG